MLPAPERTRDGAAGPAVSVVLLPRSRGGPLARSLGDAVAQLDVRVEVLAPAAHAAVRRLDLDVDAHPADVLEAAAAAARGAWIAFIEGGDRWHPAHLRSAIARAESARAAWIHGAVALLGADGAVVGTRAAAPAEGLAGRLRHANVIGGASSVVCRREALLARRPFDRRLAALVLWAAWLDLAALPSATRADVLVAERWEEDRAVLDARATAHDVRLLHSEGRIDAGDGTALADLGNRFVELGHGRDAARLHALAALAGRDPGAIARAGRALRARGRVRPARPAPEWLEAR